MEQLQPVPREGWEQTTVGEVMEPLDPEAMLVNSDRMAVDAMMQMAEHDLGRLLVTDHSGNIIGIISSSDVRRLVRVKSGLGM